MKNLFKIFGVICACFFGLFGFSKAVNASTSIINIGIGNNNLYSSYLHDTSSSTDITLFRYTLYTEDYSNVFNFISFSCELNSSLYNNQTCEVDSTFLISNQLFTIDNFSRSGGYSSLNTLTSNSSNDYSYLTFNVYIGDTSISSNGIVYLYCYFAIDFEFDNYIVTNIHQLGLVYSPINSYDVGYNVGYSEASTFYNNYYSSLDSNYTSLQETYNTLNSNYTSLQETYNILNSNYNTLQHQYEDLASNEYSFSNFFWSISIVPFGVLGSMLNFELLGINLFGLVTGIITAFLVVWLIKKFLLK